MAGALPRMLRGSSFEGGASEPGGWGYRGAPWPGRGRCSPRGGSSLTLTRAHSLSLTLYFALYIHVRTQSILRKQTTTRTKLTHTNCHSVTHKDSPPGGWGYRGAPWQGRGRCSLRGGSASSSVILSSLEWSDTKVYAP